MESTEMRSRLEWLSEEARSYGWNIVARYHATEVTYVLEDEHGEMEFNTVDGVEQKIRSLCLSRNLPPLRERKTP